MKKFLLKHIRIWITLLVGLAFVLGILGINNGFHYESTKETMKDLCDAFSIPGFLMMGLGILIFISNDGGFSMLSYGVKRIFAVFKKDPRMETFYEYKKKRLEKPAPYKHLLIAGGMFFLIGMLFLIIFYVV